MPQCQRFGTLALVLALLGGCVVEPAHERVVIEQPPPPVVVRVAPPPEYVEEVPPPRPGFIWVRGHWRWNGAAHEWERGHWEAERVGYRYARPRWERIGEEWHFTAGFWIR